MSFFALSEREHFGRLDAEDRARIAKLDEPAHPSHADWIAERAGWASAAAEVEAADKRAQPGRVAATIRKERRERAKAGENPAGWRPIAWVP